MKGAKRKYFKGQEPQTRYKVPVYTLEGVVTELIKAESEFNVHINNFCEMHNTDDSLYRQQVIVECIRALDAWRHLYLKPRIVKILAEHTKDLKQYNSEFPWHKPITDPYIRQQFFLASKECFEMELETLRNMISDIVTKCKKRIGGVKKR